ncbi:Ycf66 family protein [Anabaena sp. PCC 7108]|uniref:Ycf66 family protein n=1 Tax=Anabaena sp. PCC 7108 TaxID=163908 RepID=UPI0003475890|nr:Ycf66 family protein [Anabaena sp. PCC 7108]
MLAYFLALVVGLGSLAIYISAFFFPEIHRKNDFIWSGVGLFYALVLWVFAPRITGGLLLGHVASVALLSSFGWQTLLLRRQLTPEKQQTPVPSLELVKISLQDQVSNFSLQEKLGQLPAFIGSVFSGVKGKVQQTMTKQPSTPTPKPVVEVIDKTGSIPAQSSEVEAPSPEATTERKEDAVMEGRGDAVMEGRGDAVMEGRGDAVMEGHGDVVTEGQGDVVTESQEVAIAEVTVVVVEQIIEDKIVSIPEVIPPNSPSPELVEAAQGETEAKPAAIPIEEVAPDAVIAPPAETPIEQTLQD